MKIISQPGASRLAHVVLASTLFCALPLTSHAFASLDAAANGQNSGVAPYLPATGYNFIANGVTFTILNGTVIGTTGGVSIDNTPNKVADVINFAGGATVTGSVGTTNPISALVLSGSSAQDVIFQDDVTVDNINLNNNGNAVFANNTNLIANVDNIALLANQGTLEFEGDALFTGNVGLTQPLNQLTANSLNGANQFVQLQGSTINAATILVEDDMSGNPAQGTTLILNNSAMVLTGNILAQTADEDIVDIFQPAIINGNLGGTNAFNLIRVGATSNGSQINGNIHATTTTFQNDNNLTLMASNPTITGNVDSLAAGTGTLIFQNSGTVTGTIGATNPLNQVILKGATITTVNFQDNVSTTNGIVFLAPAKAGTTALLSDGIIITGPIDNQTTSNNIGTLTFAGSANVGGTIGATHSLFAINLLGPTKTVLFNNNINVGTGNINFASGANSLTTMLVADGVTIFANVDNTTGTANLGNLAFIGSGILQGELGETSPVNQLIVNLAGTPNKTVELQGSVIQANSIFINDDTSGLPANATTLKLNNPLMTLSAPSGINVLTANQDILDIDNAALITANIGTAAKPFYLIQVAANQDTTIAGNIFAITTRFDGDKTLFIEEGFTINGNVDSLNANQGILSFLGDGTVTGTIGATNALEAIHITSTGSIVNFQNNILNDTPLYFLKDATVTIADGKTVSGPVDNLSNKNNIGTLTFLGNGTASDNIGETRPLKEIILSGVNKTVTFTGDEINTQTLFFNDNALVPNTLILNHAGLIFNGDITANTPNLDILTINQAANINGNIGTSSSPLAAVYLNGTTRMDGNLFANNTQFTAPVRLTLTDNSVVNGPITTTANNQGILEFEGNSQIAFPVGAAGFALSAINLNGSSTSQVDLNNTLFTADTFVNSGTLKVFGPQTIHGNLTINDTGILSLSPTTTPLTVTNNFNLEKGSNLTLDFSNPLATPSVVANGAANIDKDALLRVNHISTQLATSHQLFTVVQGNVGSQIYPIKAISNGILLRLKTQADNLNHQLNLTIDLLSPVTYADQSNTIGVATTLGGLINDPNLTGTLKDIVDSLRKFSSVEELNQALAELAPTVDGAVIEYSFSAALQTYHAIAQRFYEMPKRRFRKLGPTRRDYIASGLNFGDTLEEEEGYLDDEWRRNDKGRAFWGSVFGQYADQKEQEDIQGYREGSWGFVAGADFIFTNQILAGFAISSATGNIHNGVAGNAKTHTDSYQIALYGQYLPPCPFYINWFTGIAYNNYDAYRQVLFTDFRFTPQSVYHAWQYSAKAELGYAQKICCSFILVPVASLFYSLLDFRDYSEFGAGTANQLVNPNDANRLQGGLGVRLLYEHFYQKGILQPELRLRMFYNFINDNMETTSDFVGGGASFVTSGSAPTKTSYNIGASISTFECAVVATFSYDFLYRKNYQSHAGFFRLRYEW